MGFIKAEEFINYHLKVNKDIKELSNRKNEEFKFNIFIFYYNGIDALCTEHILHFHKNLKRDINVFSYGIEKREDLINFFKKYDGIYSKNKDYYRDYFYQIILIGFGSHMNTDANIYDSIESFFSKPISKTYLGYLKFFVIDNKRPFNEIFEINDKWDLILGEPELNDIMEIYNSNKEKKKYGKNFSDYYAIIKQENKCLSLIIYPFIQCISEDDSSAIIFISSISLLSYLKVGHITYEYYNKEIKNLYNDSLNISNGHFMSFESERGLLPMLSFISLNESLEIDERIYIYDHKNIKNTFNQIRTMCHIEIKEFTGNFRQLDLKKQNEILVKLKNFIKIIKPMNALGWKRRTYVLYNNDSFYFLFILIYVYINRTKKMDSYIYNCLKVSDFLHNIFKDRLKQSEIYDKLIEKHLHRNTASYLSVLIKKIIESNKKPISITTNFKIYIDIFQTPINSYCHPYELNFISNMFSSFQSYCNDKYKTYHLVVCHITDSDETILYGYTPFDKKDYWPFIFSKAAYLNPDQVNYDTLSDVNTIKIKKNDFKFILDEIKDVFRELIKQDHKKELNKNISSEEGSFDETADKYLDDEQFEEHDVDKHDEEKGSLNNETDD